MCGRYAIFAPPHKLKDLFGLDNLPNLPPRYNAAPGQDLPIIVHNRAGLARWGWTDKKTFNARSETVAEKPAFAESWQKKRRCLIPADGFYEWKKDAASGVNQPYYIYDAQTPVLAFAGLWAKAADGVTFTILTKQADGAIAQLHERMPVIIRPDQAALWFGAAHDDAKQMMAQVSGKGLTYHAVGGAVGKVANDDARLLEAI